MATSLIEAMDTLDDIAALVGVGQMAAFDLEPEEQGQIQALFSVIAQGLASRAPRKALISLASNLRSGAGFELRSLPRR
ncbi:hypothetical protein [Methylocella sp.]|uniref:hypothetical protein n=1 Tax=Methylocella sp. TaxID=1978226 RepID=UPI0035AE91E6